MSIDKDNKDFDFDSDKELFFDDNFEVHYEEEIPELPVDFRNDDYKDVLSNLSSMDPTDSVNIDYLKENRTRAYYYEEDDDGNTGKASDSKDRQKKRRNIPNLISPVAKTIKTGGKATKRLINLLLRSATLILIAAIIALLAFAFWRNHSVYGNLATAVSERNYILAAYLGVGIFLLFVELVAFLSVLFASKTKRDRRGRRVDTGRGLFSFIFIYLGSWLSGQFAGFIPVSPAPLQGIQGALQVYGSVEHTLLFLCVAGVISCVIRRCVLR